MTPHIDRDALGAYLRSVIRSPAPPGSELEAKLAEVFGPDWRDATDEQIDAALAEFEAVWARLEREARRL